LVSKKADSQRAIDVGAAAFSKGAGGHFAGRFRAEDRGKLPFEEAVRQAVGVFAKQAGELRPYVKSQRDAARYAAIFNFYTLFVYLVADMVRLPSEIINNLTRGHAVNSPSARGSRVLLSSSRLRR
jgi:hypothetical protein